MYSFFYCNVAQDVIGYIKTNMRSNERQIGQWSI